MSKNIKKSRKSVQNYTLNSDRGEVQIDLNNFTAVCTVTNNPKKFYHSYLANLIATKYDNNFSTFLHTYVSREGKASTSGEKKVEVLEERISKLYQKIRELKTSRNELQAESQSV